jgi:hypothetical protein
MQRQAEGLDGGRDTEYDDIPDLIPSSGTDFLQEKILLILAREIEVEARRERKDVLQRARLEAVGVRRRSLPLADPGFIFLS